MHIQVNMSKVKYQYFDFHNECRNMQWHRIEELIKNLEEDLLRYG